MSAGIVLRPFAEPDRGALIALWRACGLTHPSNDPDRDIDTAIARPHARLLLAEDGPRIVGSILMGEDGHRAWIYFLAVAPDRQGQGLGVWLLGEAEAWARARGLAKLNLMVRASNLGVAAFYDRQGFARSDVTVFQKVLQATGAAAPPLTPSGWPPACG